MNRRIALRMIITAALTLGLTVAVTLAMRAADAPRDVVLVARGMAFYADADPSPNPTVRLRPGELVRLILRNESVGYTHDLWVPDLDLTVDSLAPGDSRVVLVRIPSREGRVSYVCRPHAAMMRGVFEISGS